MRFYSYVLARDYGFAPNPFQGWCTLATCKPQIRSSAALGDWVIGTGAKTKYNFEGRLIYAIQVQATMSFDEYWNDSRFQLKKPILNGSLKQMYGDNIYHKQRGKWLQEDSHHSLANGRINRKNVEHDTRVDRILASSFFVYFGENAPVIPARFRKFGKDKEDACCLARGHRILSEELGKAFTAWIQDISQGGLCGSPLEFKRAKKID